MKNDTLMDFVYRTYLANDMATLSIVNEKGDMMLPSFNTFRQTSFQYIHIRLVAMIKYYICCQKGYEIRINKLKY